LRTGCDGLVRCSIADAVYALNYAGPSSGRPTGGVFRPNRRGAPRTMSSESPSGQARPPPDGWRDRIKSVLMSRDAASRIRKRTKILARVRRYLNVLRWVMHVSHLSVISPKYRLGLLSAGYLWLLVLPLSQLGIDTYIDENALQPSQVPLSPPAHIMCIDHVHS
jgi:hypothetical protein